VKSIMFAKEYEELILKKRKLCTIRKGKRDFEIGEKVALYCNNKRIAIAKIESIEYKKLSEITEEDAKKDGFESKKALKKALKKHYKKVRSKDMFTIIHFRLVRVLKSRTRRKKKK